MATDYYHYEWACPYFEQDSKCRVCCEGATIICFRTPALAIKHFTEFCANNPGWKQCPVARANNEYYAEKELKEYVKKTGT